MLHKAVMHYKNKIHSCILMWILTASMAVLTGCATGAANYSPEYRYGNPDYGHPRDLPQNQAAAWGATQPPSPALPAITKDEYETLGDGFLKKDNFALAYLHYEKALEMNPGDNRLEYKIGKTYLAAGKLDDARRQFEKAASKDAENALVWEGLGKVCFLERDYVSAENHFIKALTLRGSLWESFNCLGYIYDTRGDHAQAVEYYLAALAVKPDNGIVYNNLGVSYMLSGRFPEAVEAFRGAILHNYVHEKVYNNLGFALANVGRFTEALEAFTQAVGKPLAYNNLGSVHLQAGRYDEAIRCFETAIELDPRHNALVRKNLQTAQIQKEQAQSE